jgi:hypothetical protein
MTRNSFERLLKSLAFDVETAKSSSTLTPNFPARYIPGSIVNVIPGFRTVVLPVAI